MDNHEFWKLTLKATIKIVAGDMLFFIFFRENQILTFHMNCLNHMKYRAIFSLINIKRKFRMSSAAVVTGALRLK